MENPNIADSAVCAVETDYEELPRAYLVLKDFAKGKVTEEEVKNWIAERVARYKRLDGGVVVCCTWLMWAAVLMLIIFGLVH